MQIDSDQLETTAGFAAAVLPLMAVVLSGFLIIGIVLPVLPRHVHADLRFDTFVVGLVTAAQFVASLTSRLYAGRFADTEGGRRAVVVGLLMATIGGSFYLWSLAFAHHRHVAIALILVGRAIVGGAESFMITGATTLALTLSGPRHTGRVIAWIGTAMFAAFALGAPVGTIIYNLYGFLWIALVSMGLPLLSIVAARRLRDSSTKKVVTGSVMGTISSTWLPGLGAAFNGVGFSALISFSALLFARNGWEMAWLPVTAFALALIAARLLFGHLVDRIGGILIGGLFTAVTALGQLLMCFAPSPWIAGLASALTGAGWAMVYPAFGAEAVRRTGAANKGLVMAAYSTMPDFAIGISSPLLGLAVSDGKIGMIYLWSAVAVLMGIPAAFIAWRVARSTAIPR